MKSAIALALVLVIVGLAAHVAGASVVDDIDIILSDVPLQKIADGEHQANDMGPVLLLIVETCNGVAI